MVMPGAGGNDWATARCLPSPIWLAMKEPLLQNLNVRATQFWLEHAPGGPVWRIRFWAAKLKNPNQMADIGEMVLSAKTGEVVKNKLHPNSVD